MLVTVCAAVVSAGAAVIRCVQLFYYTDSSTGYVNGSGKKLIIELYIFIAAGILLFAFSAFPFHGKNTDKSEINPGKGMFLLSLLCAAGMFYDFIYQCVRCYLYVDQTSYPAANRIVPMVLCAVFALVSCAYFAVLCQCSRTRRFEFGRLWFLRLAPFFWAFCNVLVGMTDYGNVIYDVDSALKYLALIFGLLFFFSLFASREEKFSRVGSLVFFGCSYGALCFVLAFPRIIAFAAGAGLPAPDFSAPAFLFTGIFAFAVSCRFFLKRRPGFCFLKTLKPLPFR